MKDSCYERLQLTDERDAYVDCRLPGDEELQGTKGRLQSNSDRRSSCEAAPPRPASDPAPDEGGVASSPGPSRNDSRSLGSMLFRLQSPLLSPMMAAGSKFKSSRLKSVLISLVKSLLVLSLACRGLLCPWVPGVLGVAGSPGVAGPCCAGVCGSLSRLATASLI